jgi:NADPH:quinone reductase-like Zn-dependent oxidoreductase
MHAIVIDNFKEPGSVRDMPEPALEDNAVLVRITVAGVNPVDWKVRAGQSGEKHFPLVLGQDFAGIVERAGNGVSRVKTGDRVFGCARDHGSYAEYTTIRDGDQASPFARIPDGIDDATAAALPTPGLTALASLDLLGIGEGSEVLVIGAAGAVGSIAVQLARARKAKVVAAVKPGKARTSLDDGADLVVEVDNAFVEPLALAHPAPFAAVLDLVNDDAGLKQNLPLYAKGATVVNTTHQADEAWFREHGLTAINVVMNQTPASSPQGLETLARHVLAGDLTVAIAGERKLTEAPAVLDGMQKHELEGKFVLRVA